MSEPLPVKMLHHVARTTKNAERSRAFYRDVLGFREIRRPNFNFRGAWLFNYGFQIHIIEHDAADRASAGPIDTHADHLAFAVDDFAEVERRLKEHGIEYHKQVNAGGIPQIFFHDPDGHHIEIGMYPPTPPHMEVNDQGRWEGIFEATAGKWQGEPFVRPDQGEFEEREPLR